MKRFQARFVVLLMSVLLSACASKPIFDTENVDTKTTPEAASKNIAGLQNKSILWGGVLIAATNLKSVTQFEVLAYPLDSKQRPETDKKPLGRFIAQQDGYLETSDYTQGKLFTVRGVLTDVSQGKIGESEYTYPIVKINQQHLWPQQSQQPSSRVQFGIGVLFRN